MEHEEAVTGDFCDRYLLGQLSEAEREEFEAHFLQCPACAEELRTSAAFIEAWRAVFRERLRWRRWIGPLVLWWWRLEDWWRGKR